MAIAIATKTKVFILLQAPPNDGTHQAAVHKSPPIAGQKKSFPLAGHCPPHAPLLEDLVNEVSS